MNPCIAIVVGAGRGHRFGGDLPKQYHALAGSTVIARAIGAFLDHRGVDAVLPVIHEDDRALFAEATRGLAGEAARAKLLPPVGGGATRQDSVRLGLESLLSRAPGTVLIHDAARPFVEAGLIDRVIGALASTPGAIPGLPVVDTLKRDAAGLVGATVQRDGLIRAQTPQGFRFDDILSAHRRAVAETQAADLTDDAAVAERFGLAVAIVAGHEDNVKLTTQDDMQRARRMLGGGETRTGFGFDVHRFEAGAMVTLCGVEVPHTKGLAGHSDADVGLHALTDALLGAIGAGDIGAHFPPNDATWRGAPSAIFAARAAELIAERGARIVNVDVTLVCEAPKIGPHRDAMRARIAEILGIEVDRVSVKATTTERLGFTGREEGIAAQAVATVGF